MDSVALVKSAASFMPGMKDETRVRIGRALAGSSVVLGLVGMAAISAVGRWDFMIEGFVVVNGVLGVGLGALAWVVLAAQPRNGAVWTLAWSGLFGAILVGSTAIGVLIESTSASEFTYATFSALSPSELSRASAFAFWPFFWLYLPAAFPLLTLGLLLFPDGRLLTPRWRVVGWLSVAVIAATSIATAWLFHPWSRLAYTDEGTGVAAVVADLGYLLLFLFAVLSIASLILRYRRSTSATRRQIRVIAIGGLGLVAGSIGSLIVDLSASGSEIPPLEPLLLLAGVVVFTTAFAVGILRYRLYNLDAVISKSVAYLGLATAITLLYAAVVVVPLLILGQSEEGGPGLVLPIVATAVVAVLFEPIRSRMQRWANRLVYGERATPHEVLSEVTARLSESDAATSVDDLAEALAGGTGADRAVVWLQSHERLEPAGGWQRDDVALAHTTPVEVLPNSDLAASALVRHGSDVLGAVTIWKPAGDPITPADKDLLADVAAGAGLVLRNILLNRQLEERARQVHESRRRLIAAQDAERHRLERNLHDGAQQQVVALKVKLGIAKTIAEREGAGEIADRASALAEDVQQAVDALRGVAHGIYPPLLEAEGLEAALRAVNRSAGNGLVIEGGGLGRYSREVEATAYFFLVEAAERARMSGSSLVRADLQDRSGELIMTIEHDGRVAENGLATVTDRVEVLGGQTATERISDGLTRITSRLPTASEPV